MIFSLAKLDAAAENYANYENFSLANLDIAEEYYNSTYDLYEYTEELIYSDLERIIVICIILISCSIGLLGNGYIIWLLGFQIKRNPFTTFVLSLAIADFGFLISLLIYCIDHFTNFLQNRILSLIWIYLFQITYISGQFLLTAISIDRCVSVLFPIWHRCSRPRRLSIIVCAFIWIFSLVLCVILNIMQSTEGIGDYNLFGLHFLVTAVACFPLITICTVILFIKVCFKPKQKKQGRLLLMILITLLCFLILAFPLNVFLVIVNFVNNRMWEVFNLWDTYFLLCACLNSSVNPGVYFLVGKTQRGQFRGSVRSILQKVFKEDDIIGMEQFKHSYKSSIRAFLKL